MAYCTETALDQEQEGLHADSRIEKLDHLFETEPSLLTCESPDFKHSLLSRVAACLTPEMGKELWHI